MKPAIAVQAIFTFVQSWNNHFIPALVLHSDKKKTLPVLIAQLRSADFLKFDMGQVYVMIAFSIFPVIIVYILLSKFIVEGVSAGVVKGYTPIADIFLDTLTIVSIAHKNTLCLNEK